jgi:hypothetical protein
MTKEYETDKELSIEVRHVKERKIYELYVIPYTIIDRGNGMVTRRNAPRSDGGFRYTVEETKRKNQKRIDILNQIIIDNQDMILEKFLAGDNQAIIDLFL